MYHNVSHCVMVEETYGIRRVLGVDVHWVEVGEGRPLVLLHGLGDSHRTWTRVAPTLARTHRVIAPDLPGHGLSGRPDESYALDWYARVMGSWLGALDLHDVDLVGHSYGGGVAQYMLLEERARIRRLALVAPGGLGREVGVGLRLFAATSSIVERIGQPFLGPVMRMGMHVRNDVFDPEDIDFLAWASAKPGTARSLARTVRGVIDWRGQTRHFLDRAHEVAELPAVALFWGNRDPMIPFLQAERMRSMLDGIALTQFECGHFPHRERADAFGRALGDFLDASWLPVPRLRPRGAGLPGRRPSVWRRAWQAIASGARRIWRSGTVARA